MLLSRRLAVALLLMVALVVSTAQADDLGSWQYGRASFFGTDAWSIHKGSCGYGYIYKDEPLGWNVAAMPDGSPDYAESCGRCYEVACNPSGFSDNYGQALDRKGACYDADSSLVIRIVDTCPCFYPANAYSNKRWCCGDMPHLDLSVWAFERLASTKWGVIGLKFRRVPCDFQPNMVAPPVANPTTGEEPPAWRKKPVRDWPEADPGSLQPMIIYQDGYVQNGWRDTSYNAQYKDSPVRPMDDGKKALCYSVSPKGAIMLAAPTRAFANATAVDIWIYMGTSTQLAPGTVVTLVGPLGECQPVDLSGTQATGFKPTCQYCEDYYWKFRLYMSAFAGYGTDTVINSPKFFKGCGGNTAAQLASLEVRNYGQQEKLMCVDHLQLVM